MRSIRAWLLFAFVCSALFVVAGPGCGGGGQNSTYGSGNEDASTEGGGDDGTTGRGDTSLFGGDTGTGNKDGGGRCTPRTCSQLKPPVGCGKAGDGCGGIIDCGSCKAPQTCGGGDADAGKPAVPGQCGGSSACKPKTCADYPGLCGQQSDGCGGLTTACNEPCATGESCGADPTKPGQCGKSPIVCTPKTCAAYPGVCGQQSDGCGGLTTNCNPCTAPATCGGGGTPDKCGIPASSDASLCVPKTSCPAGQCGSIGDGCGGIVACATTCTAPQTCGGGGTPGACGSSCTPKTTCPAGECGSISDGCGGTITCPTMCVSPQTCGGGGTAGQCGSVVSTCTPLTCAQTCAAAGIPIGQCCGQFSDGCGGLTVNCGGCIPPAICGGGGTASQCGDSNIDGGTGSCTGLCGQIPTCDGGTNTTTVTGRVYAPTDPKLGYGAPDPIQHAHVFIPNDPTTLTAFGSTVACACDTASGPAIASTYSAIDGTFTLTNVPAGTNIPIVIQLGRWRRVYYTNITACTAAPAPGTLGVNGITDDTSCRAGNGCNTRLPRVQAEFNAYDNIPRIAVATGSADPIECVLPKLGIAASQYSTGGGAGRVQLYYGNGAYMTSTAATEAQLTGSTATMENFDLLVMDCWGGEYDQTAAALANMQTYANAGGRVYASHYSYVWAFTNDPWGCGGSSTVPTATCTTANHTVADWYVDQGAPNGGNPVTATIDNPTMLSWLSQPLINVITAGAITLQQPRHDANGVIAPPAQLYAHVAGAPTEPLEFTWNTPPYAMNQCGRVLFSDFHVNTGGSASGTFPGECGAAAPLTAQEKVMEFMLFDLGDCVTNITPPPPPTCTKKTCASYPAGTCGDQSDGCGGIIPCATCPSGMSCIASKCVPNNCTKLTCADYPAGTCGQQSDGCGGLTVDCGPCGSCKPLTCADYAGICGQQSDGCGGLTTFCNPCTAPATCGGGGTPGKCGLNDAGACVPACPSGVKCGPAGDGCGGTIMCGNCTPPQTCGGGGTPGVCGSPPCTPKTCSSFPSGTCGQQSDGCGGLTKDCGMCTPPQTCGGGGTPGMCGAPPCTPLTCTQTCAAAGISSGCCGQFSDGCGGLTADCGMCTGTATCGGGGVANMCGGMSAQ